MRKFNSIVFGERFKDQNFSVCSPLYRSKDGGKTTNIDEAAVDEFGLVVSIGVSDQIFTQHPVYSKVRPFSFNPLDPSARQLAFEARANFDGLTSSPNIYTDKFEYVSYANNVSSILCKKLRALSNPKTNE